MGYYSYFHPPKCPLSRKFKSRRQIRFWYIAKNKTCVDNAIVMPPIQDITPTATDATAAPIK
ncbi:MULTISPECIES: hypothetical protein [Campylobacter]|uniref:hypothetical protein n=1 Tax=Campylobacter TaxID=194 RepID=UPI0023EFFE8C|nr:MULTISPECIES: hypothetical protein [Campylobacter]MCI6641435.1 hypothetical protein [Campylobacter sp.]MDD7422566.1 hypothetical protein [Campylobacter hominis]MDY3117217.1 hypothetical protein [Campylobacter hominis]